MDAFGVRFAVNNRQRFEALRSLYAELKQDKDAGEFRDPAEWVRLVPDDVKGKFSWPTPEEREHWLAVRDATPIAIPTPSQQLGAEWDFYRVFEAIEESEYDVVECEMVGDGLAEMRIDPQAYPYGGVGPLIALAEAFGFTVLGVNECGKYESCSELLASRATAGAADRLRRRERLMSRGSGLLAQAWTLVREHRRAYVVLNVLYYGLVLIFMGVAALNPGLQDGLLRSAAESVTSGPLPVGEAYANARVLQAIALTFVVNLVLAGLAQLTIPSMVIPFLGILFGLYRAGLWGLMFYPGHPKMQTIMIPHSLTLLIEGQAYVLVMLAAWLQGWAFLFPASAGVQGRWRGYVEGLKQTGRVYVLVVPILLVAAIYEAIEVIWMRH